ncbi:MAG TPA: hypothetical protein VE967_02700 [Gemmatimonadaceae bacterium]|nr:hypothetical protein [Gemmatimonadaceae bacterium]
MKMNRRDALFAGGLSLLGSTRLRAQPAETPAAQAQTPQQAQFLAALQRNRMPLTMGAAPGGVGWDWLVREAGKARFTLIGEEHGVAETAAFSSALFQALRATGYTRVAVELSPPIAEDVEAAARRGGYDGIAQLLKNPDILTFSHLREEIQFLADVVKTAPQGERVLWGFDREVFSDRYLIAKLEAKVPASARDAYARLKQASLAAFEKSTRTKNPDDLFLLAEDPALARAVMAAWPNRDRESDLILRTLEGSLAIESAERGGGLWPYAAARAGWFRENFASRLREEQDRKPPVKVLMKFGYNHVIRGVDYINVFEVGSMADEVAALTGDSAFHVIVLPGSDSHQAVLGGNRHFNAVATADVDDFRAGENRLTRVFPNASASGHEVIDLRAARPFGARGLESWNADVVKTVYGYDAAVIWKGGHASTSLE